MKVDHVVIQGQEFVCLHCGRRYAPTLPSPINMYAAMVRSFLKDHKACKPLTDLHKRFDSDDFHSF